MDVCTIIAKNYLAHARVLAQSLAVQHPQSRLHVLVVDDFDGFVNAADEPFDVVTPSELGIAAFERMCGYYDVTELCTAVKPWLLRRLVDRDGEGTVYLDPDVRIYAPLDDVFAAVAEHGLVLTPHNLDPMPRDGRKPSEQDILHAGTYNLGFIGLGAGDQTNRLLDWWAERLVTDCIVDPQRGFFVDQRWVDFLPGMVPSFQVLRDRGFNVAYWNLASRPIGRARDGTWTAADVPLRLFHFSGFDHSRPTALSKHQDRFRLREHEQLAELFADYADELRAQGVDAAALWPYGYARAASGMELTRDIRRSYRELVLEEDFEASVFEPEGEAALMRKLSSPAAPELGGEQGVTRFLASLHRRHPYLNRTFPDLAGGDGPRYLAWAANYSGGMIPPSLVPPEARAFREAEATPSSSRSSSPSPSTSTSPSQLPRPERPFGVNVAGYLNAELGVGEIARQAITALDAATVPLLPLALPAPGSRQGHAFAHRGLWAGGYPINLVCVNADMLTRFAHDVGMGFFEGRMTIGWWWWELSRFPQRWLGALSHVDRLWAGSRFVAETLAEVADVPISVVPVPITVARTWRREPERFGLPADRFSFLFSYDYSSVLARKNPLGVVEAFLRAFPEPGEAILVLKSINSDQHAGDHARVRSAADGHEHVRILDGYLEPVDKDRLVASCDSYVSLHRSEGFGVTMAEAMALGKPVIATGYSGNLDYMTEDNSWLVDHTLVPVGPGADPYPEDALWAEPSTEHAAALMREVFEDQPAAAARALRGAEEIAASRAPAVAGAQMADLLRDVAKELPGPVGGWEASAGRGHTHAADALVNSGNTPDPERGGSGPRRALRRLVLRFVKPHAAYQRQVDRELIAALRDLGVSTRELNEHVFAVEAAGLRGLRDLERRQRSHLELEQKTSSDRVDALARRVDELRLATDRRFDEARDTGVGGWSVDRAERPEVPEAYPRAPSAPWTNEYNEAHAAFVARALEDERLIASLCNGGTLPEAWGAGFDERVVELPWLASRRPTGTVLDAGATLNHRYVLERLRPAMRHLHIVTVAPEERAYPQLDVSYLFADLRELPLADDVYDRVISVSTLEHVGLDLSHFGADTGPAEDPQAACLAATDELRRVLRPGGTALLTVPVGLPESFGWTRTLSLSELDAVIEHLDPAEVEIAYFRHDRGWREARRDEVADARYRDHLGGVEPREDGVVAAEAVACVEVTAAR